MSDEQARRAIERMYDSTNARDELTDDEALVLLKWAEVQFHALGARNLDDDAFDEAVHHLNRVLQNINRYTGQRAYKTPEELTAMLNDLATHAQALGANVQAAQLAVPEAQTADGDNIAIINALTALVTPGQGQTPAADASTQAAAAVQPPPAPPPAPKQDEPPADESLLDKFKKLF